jgi:hypothetical protein
VPCVKRLYSGSVLPVTRREILQFTFMLGQYQHLCLVEEFQKLKDVLLLCITFGIKKEAVLIGYDASADIHSV